MVRIYLRVTVFGKIRRFPVAVNHIEAYGSIYNSMGWMLADHSDGLLSSSFCLIRDSSVGLPAGIQSAGESVPKTLVQILHSAEEDHLSPFDLKIACLSQRTKITTNKHESTGLADISTTGKHKMHLSANWRFQSMRPSLAMCSMERQQTLAVE